MKTYRIDFLQNIRSVGACDKKSLQRVYGRAVRKRVGGSKHDG